MIGSACMWRYRSILSLLQRPMRLMMSLFTPEQSSAMTPAARRDHTETSLYVKPRWVPARILTVALRWAVIIVGVTFIQRPLGVLKWERGVFVGAPCCQRCVTRLRKASFGHNTGSPVSPFFTPHTIFMCGEDKHHKCGDKKFIVRGGGGIKDRAADTEGYI